MKYARLAALILPILLLLGQPALARPSEPPPAPPAHAVTRPNRSRQADRTAPGIAATRPSLPHPLHFDTPHFRVHYTLSGIHAVPLADENDDEIPDYVEFVGETAEQTWATLVRKLFWPQPFPDGDLGGDGRTDIYLRQLSYMGWTAPDERHCGDHPFTAQVERTGCSAFLLLDNDLWRSIESIRVVLAHEFMHVLQYGLDADEPSDWLWEAWAVWAEEQVFDEINDYRRFLPDLFAAPDASLNQHPYAAVLLPLWIGEHVSLQAVRDTWLQAARANGMVAVSAALAPYGVRAPRLLLDFGAALVVRYPCPALTPYCWEEGETFPAPAVEGVLTNEKPWASERDGNQRLDGMGRDVIRLKVEEPSRLILETQTRNSGYTLQVLALTEGELRLTMMQESAADGGQAVQLFVYPQAHAEYWLLVSNPAGDAADSYTLVLKPLSEPDERVFLPRVESGR